MTTNTRTCTCDVFCPDCDAYINCTHDFACTCDRPPGPCSCPAHTVTDLAWVTAA